MEMVVEEVMFVAGPRVVDFDGVLDNFWRLESVSDGSNMSSL